MLKSVLIGGNLGTRLHIDEPTAPLPFQSFYREEVGKFSSKIQMVQTQETPVEKRTKAFLVCLAMISKMKDSSVFFQLEVLSVESGTL